MSICDLSILFDKDSHCYLPGEPVAGKVVVKVHKDCKNVHLDLSREWRTHGKGNRTSGDKGSMSIPKLQNWRSGRTYEYAFKFKAPDGPPTYHGHYLNVDWYLTVTAKILWGVTRLLSGQRSHPNCETEFLLRPRKRPLTIKCHETTKDSTQLYVLAGAILILIGIAVLLFQIWLDRTRLIDLAWGLVPFVIGIIVLSLNLENALSQLQLGPVLVSVAPGKDEFTLQGMFTFQPRRSIVLERVSIILSIRESVTKGYESNAKTHTHVLFTKKMDDTTLGKLVSKQPFETSLLLAFPEILPPTFKEDDNQIIWRVKFEVVPRDWLSWRRDIVIQVHN